MKHQIPLETWTTGFVFKNIFFKLLTDTHIIKALSEHAKKPSTQFFEIRDHEIVITSLYCLHRIYNNTIFACPVVGNSVKDPQFLIYDILGKIKLSIELPVIPKDHNDISVLYYYSHLHKTEALYYSRDYICSYKNFFEKLKIYDFCLFLSKFTFIPVDKTLMLNNNQQIVKKTTFLFFKINEFVEPNKLHIEEFCHLLNKTQSFNFSYLKHLMKEQGIKRHHLPYIIQLVGENKRNFLIVKLIVDLLAKSLRDFYNSQKNVKDTSYFFDYFKKINYGLLNNRKKLISMLNLYFMVLHAKALICFPDMCFTTDLSSMLNSYIEITFQNQYLYLECVEKEFKIRFYPAIMEEVKLTNNFIYSDNMVKYLKVQLLKSISLVKIVRNDLVANYTQLNRQEHRFMTHSLHDNIKLNELEAWHENSVPLLYIIKSLSRSYHKVYQAEFFIILVNYLKANQFEKFNEIAGNAVTYTHKNTYRYMYYLLLGVYCELYLDQKTSPQKEFNGNIKDTAADGESIELSHVYYKRAFLLFLTLYGDPRWRSKRHHYFFSFLTEKLRLNEKNPLKKLEYEEIEQANRFNSGKQKGHIEMFLSDFSSAINLRSEKAITKVKFDLRNSKALYKFILECHTFIRFPPKDNKLVNDINTVENKYKELGNLMYVWGFNNYSQLGFISDPKMPETSWVKIPRLLKCFDTKITKISFGYDSCLACDINGDVFSWGSNAHGKLGLGKSNLRQMPYPIKIRGLSNIKKISCGTNHCLALSTKGEVYAWGSGENGELGCGRYENEYMPSKLNLDEKIIFKTIACGAAHSIFIDIEDNLYECGDNSYGQLCHNQDKLPLGKVNSPLLLRHNSFKKVLKVKTGDAHVLIINDQNELWGWGHCELGQLGFKPIDKSFIDYPVRISLPSMPIKIVAGSVYSFVLTINREVWGFGLNDFFQLGVETPDEYVFQPICVDKLRNCDVLSFKCGSNHSLCYVRTKKGYRLYCWGMNKHSQLSLEGTDKSTVVELEQFRNVHFDYIAAGGYHSGVIMS